MLVTHTTYNKKLLMQKKQEGVILQYHQNLSVLTYMYTGVIRITSEYLIFYLPVSNFKCCFNSKGCVLHKGSCSKTHHRH